MAASGGAVLLDSKSCAPRRVPGRVRRFDAGGRRTLPSARPPRRRRRGRPLRARSAEPCSSVSPSCSRRRRASWRGSSRSNRARRSASRLGEVGRAAAEARFMAGEASRPTGLSFPSERPGIVLLHRRRAARHRRDHLPLELSRRHARPQDCARARLGQHRRLQAGVADAVVRGLPDGAARTGWRATGRRQSGHRRRLGGRRRVGSGPPACTASALRDRPGSGPMSTKRRRGDSRACSSSSAARTRRSSSDCDDLDSAAREIVAAAFLCSGQRCTALSRVIVSDAQADALVERIVAHVNRIRSATAWSPAPRWGRS